MINYCEEKLEKLGCEIVDEFKSGVAIGNCKFLKVKNSYYLNIIL